MTLGQRISAARKQHGWTQKDLAARTLKEDGCSISPQYLNDIERDRRVPSSYVLDKLAAQLECSADELHFLVGQVPLDIISGEATSERFEVAYKAFRRTFGR